MGEPAAGLLEPESNLPPSGSDYASLLTRVTLFAPLDRVTLARLAGHFEPIRFARGQDVFLQGDPPDGLYLVVRGSFGVYACGDDGGSETCLGTLGSTDVFGEMALLTGEPRSATVRAEEDAEALRLEPVRFLDLLRKEPEVGRAVAATVSRRLRVADQSVQAARRAGLPPVLSAEGVAPAAPGRAALPAPVVHPRALPTPVARRVRLDRRAVGALLSLGVLLAFFATPPPPGLTPAGWQVLGVLLAIIPLMALDVLLDGLAGLLLVAGLALVVPSRVALGGYATTSWVLIVAVLVIAAAIASTGLLYRLALWAVARARGGFAGQALALSTVLFAASPTVPTPTGRLTLIGPAVAELVEALGYHPRSRPAAGLAMATLTGFGQLSGAFLTGSSTSLLVYAVLPEATRASVSWLEWAIRSLPAHLVIFAVSMAVVLRWYRPREGDLSPHAVRRGSYNLALQRALLGPLSRQERLALGASIALLGAFVTQPLHRLEPAWLSVLVLAGLAMVGVVGADTLRGTNWSFALLFGALASVAEAFTAVGLDRWLAGLLAQTVEAVAGAPLLFVLVLSLLSFAVSFVVRWQAAAPLLTIVVSPVAAAAGIDPWVVAIVALVACNGFFLPYQSTIYLALYHGTGGQVFTHPQARPAALAYAVASLLGLAISVPLWRAMGLL